MKITRSVLALIIFLVIIAAGAYLYYIQTQKNRFGNPPGPSAVYTAAKPPSARILTYKGFWMPCSFMDDSCQPMNDVNLLKEMGVNIIGIAPNIKINSNGEVNSFPMDFIDKRLDEITKAYYQAGIRVFISPELDFTQDLNARGMGEPKPIPKEAAAKSGFLDKYDLIIADLSKLAEKYQVEMFSPMNEPDMKVGINVASAWGQKILPVVKQNYKGKVMWKLGMAVDQSSGDIDFKGYDILGIDFTAPGPPEAQSLASFPQIANKAIDDALGWAKRDNVPELILSEVGVWGGAIRLSDEGKTQVHRIIFEQGKGKVKGFVILDPPPDQGWSLKNTKSMEEIKVWFKEKID